MPKSALKKLISIMPGPIAAWVNAWLGVFEGTFFGHPHWQSVADNTAGALGTIAALVIVLICQGDGRRKLTRLALQSIGIGAIFGICCIGFYFVLSFGGKMEVVETLKTIWMFCYVFMLLSVISAITFGVLSRTS